MANLSNINNKFIVEDSGDVGIGVTSATTKLHIGGTAPGDSIIRQDSTVSGTNWEIGERAAGKWQIFEDDGDSIVATFMSTGNVGIGTDSPVGKLQVSLPAYTNEDTNSQQAIFGVDSGYGVRIGYNETDNKGYINVLKPGVAWGSLILQEDIGNVGIGTISPNAKLKIEGNSATNGLSIKSAGNGGTYPFMVTWSGGTEGDTFCIDDNLRVGIGTNSPTSLLQIKKATLPRITLTRTGILDWFIGNPSQGTSNTFSIGTNSGSNTEILNLSNTGNVGIGISFATAKLQIHNTNAGAAAVAAYLVNASTSLNTETRLAFAAHTNDDIATNRYSYISTINTSGSNGQDMIFATNATGAGGSERMRITSAGDVLIHGTYNPYSQANRGNITLNGSNSNIIAFTNNSSNKAYIYHNGLDFEITNGVAGVLKFATNSTERMRIDGSGNVGIGITSGIDANLRVDANSATLTQEILKVKGGGSGGAYGFLVEANNGDDLFKVNTLSYDSYFPNGKVGIGTTSPQGKLDSVAPVADLTDFGRATGSALNIRIGNVIGYLGQINFCNDAAPAFGYGSIGMVMTSGSGVGLADMVFGTKSSGAAAVSTERMRITSSGNTLLYNSLIFSDSSYVSDYSIRRNANALIFSGGSDGFFFNRDNNSVTDMWISGDGITRIGGTANLGYASHNIQLSAASSYALIVRNSDTSTTNSSVMQFNRAETTATTQGYCVIYRQGDAATGTNRWIVFANGNIQNTNNSYGSLSDERKKENIVDATPKLDDLMKVKVRNFNLKGEKIKQIGVVAQELEEVFPGMIDESKIPDSEDETLYKGVKYSVFVPMLIKAIQELKAEIELLKSK